jgi:hypothetical protein
MNEQERTELEQLKARQARLAAELNLLGGQIRNLQLRLEKPLAPEPSIPAPSPVPPPSISVTPPTPAPPLKTQPALIRSLLPSASPAPPAATSLRPEGAPVQKPAPIAAPPILAAAKVPPPTPGPVPAAPRQELVQASAREPRSLEMRLGTYWFVRVGIVMVLTGLVFFGHLAYENYISRLGPGGKVALLYVASGLLLGAGLWWQRASVRPNLKNYGQVLFAGGLAALYFTTYAAHHVQQLLVIRDAVVDGILLLLCAGFIVWIADRKKSEVLALFAVGLAFYSSIITRVGFFTLYSNLVLTLAAVFFLVRNRWAVLTFGSLVASYAAYAFWRFFDGSEWHWAPELGIWSGTFFLFGYWLVFTAGVFLCRDEKFAGQHRAGFLTLNNGGLLILFLLTMFQVRHGDFWKFMLIYGGVLLGLAALARQWLRTEPLARNSYLAQGLLLATIGLISKFSGLQLALILGLESVFLMLAAQQAKNLVLCIGAYVSAALSVAWGIDGMRLMEPSGIYLGVGLGGLMLFNALAAHRGSTVAPSLTLRPQPSYFTVLALVVWFAATWDNAAREQFPLFVATEAILLIFSLYLLRVPEIALLGLGYLVLGQTVWVYDAFAGTLSPPWWDALLMLSFSMGMSYWWARQRVLNLDAVRGTGWQDVKSLPALAKNVVLLAGVLVAVKFAGGWTLERLAQPTALSFYLPFALGTLMLADALFAHWQSCQDTSAAGTLRPQPAYSAALALVVWLAVTWHHTARENFALILASEGLLLTCSFYLLRMRELTALAQSYMVLAQLVWMLDEINAGSLMPSWKPLVLLGLTAGLSLWWQRQKVMQVREDIRFAFQSVYALALVGLLYFWLMAKVGAPAWLVLTSLLALGLTTYGVWTRQWFIAIAAQIFMLVSGAQFFWQLVEAKPAWHFPLAPIAALALLSGSTVLWYQRHPQADERVRQPLLGLATVYRWTALVMSLVWVCDYIPERQRIWFLALLGLAAFACAGWLRNVEALLFTGAFNLTALFLFWSAFLDPAAVYWADLAAILVILLEQQLAQRWAERYHLERQVHVAVMVLGSLSVWLFVSRWVLKLEEASGGSYLTASWSLVGLAFFAGGFALRERLYRWLGLGVLGCALGRVVLFDVWKLETIYRILSFMALGIVLLVLGFIYNKYQERIREWL